VKGAIFSIITVVKNDCVALTETIKSISEQKCESLEHIIVDGSSDDECLKGIKALSYQAEHYVHEEDSGVYDAMNKGLLLAKGKWVYFLNAGDTLCDEHSLNEVMKEIKEELDFIYCDVYRESDSSVKKIWIQRAPYEYGLVRNICHQAIFYNKKNCKNFSFNLNYAISADFHLLLSLLKANRGCHYKRIPKTLVNYKVGGLSQKFALEALLERRRSFQSLMTNLFERYWNLLNLQRQIIKLVVKQRVRWSE